MTTISFVPLFHAIFLCSNIPRNGTGNFSPMPYKFLHALSWDLPAVTDLEGVKLAVMYEIEKRIFPTFRMFLHSLSV